MKLLLLNPKPRQPGEGGGCVWFESEKLELISLLFIIGGGGGGGEAHGMPAGGDGEGHPAPDGPCAPGGGGILMMCSGWATLYQSGLFM